MGEDKYMAEFNESKDNPLHKDFGVISNTITIIRLDWNFVTKIR